MRTLLKLRDEEQDKRVKHTNGTEYPKQMFIAIDKARGAVFNGWFLDPFMNTIQVRGCEDKCVHLSDVELSEIQAEFV